MARPRLALLRNISGCFKVADKSVKNFDVVSYHRGKIERFFLFFYGSGGGLVSSVISTIPPNLPLIREACGRLCFALRSNVKYSHIVADKAVRNFDMVSY